MFTFKLNLQRQSPRGITLLSLLFLRAPAALLEPKQKKKQKNKNPKKEKEKNYKIILFFFSIFSFFHLKKKK